jgi:hypothetical protein
MEPRELMWQLGEYAWLGSYHLLLAAQTLPSFAPFYMKRCILEKIIMEVEKAAPKKPTGILVHWALILG